MTSGDDAAQAWSEIGSEAVRMVLDSIGDEQRDAMRSLIEECSGILGTIRQVDFRPFEYMPAHEAVAEMEYGVGMQILGALTDAANLLGRVPPLFVNCEQTYEEHEAHPDLANEHILAVEGSVSPVRDRFCEDLDHYVDRVLADLETEDQQGERRPVALSEFCKNLSGELIITRARLLEMCGQRSKWGMITEGEEGRRKAQKSLRAVFILAFRMVAPINAEELFPKDGSELETALVVRETLMQFHARMHKIGHDIDDVDSSELPKRVSAMVNSILELCSNEAYQSIRALDRFGLQDLRERLQEWLASDQSDEREGRWAVQAGTDFSNILTNVNRREILVKRDRAIQERSAKLLEALVAYPPDTVLRWREQCMHLLSDLNLLRWRDSRLDGVVSHALDRLEALEQEEFPALLERLEDRLSELFGRRV